MPESLDEFVRVELLKWGAMKVVSSEDKADCTASFGRQASRAQLKTSGTAVIPADASVEAETVRDELPAASAAFIGTRKAAALTLVHKQSSVAVWADSKADGWSWTGGARTLARKLVDQLRRDYAK